MNEYPFQMLSNGDDQYRNTNVIRDFWVVTRCPVIKDNGESNSKLSDLNESEHVLNGPQLKHHNFIRTKTIEKGVYSMPSAQRMPPQ